MKANPYQLLPLMMIPIVIGGILMAFWPFPGDWKFILGAILVIVPFLFWFVWVWLPMIFDLIKGWLAPKKKSTVVEYEIEVPIEAAPYYGKKLDVSFDYDSDYKSKGGSAVSIKSIKYKGEEVDEDSLSEEEMDQIFSVCWTEATFFTDWRKNNPGA